MLEIQIQFVSNGRRIATLEELANLVADKVVQRIAPQLKQVPKLVPVAMSASSPVEQPKVNWPDAKLVTVAAASKLLGLSRSTLWRYVAEKRIETVHIGARSTRIRMETINRIVSEGMPGKRSK
jgi:excisionase family DNA binding protein